MATLGTINPDEVYGQNTADDQEIVWIVTLISDTDTLTVPSGTKEAFFSPADSGDDANVTLSGTTLTFNTGAGSNHAGTVLLKGQFGS